MTKPRDQDHPNTRAHVHGNSGHTASHRVASQLETLAMTIDSWAADPEERPIVLHNVRVLAAANPTLVALFRLPR